MCANLRKHHQHRSTMEPLGKTSHNIEEPEISRETPLLDSQDVKDPHFTDMDHGWSWVVLFGSFGAYCLFGATQFASGIVHIILLDKYQASISMTSVAGAIHVSLISLGAPLSSIVLERFSCRVALVASGCLFFLGYLGTAFAPNIECVILTYGIVAGLGGAVGFTSSMVVIGYNFHKRRKIALGIALSGIGFGLTFLAPVMHFIYNTYGSFGFFLLLSGIYAHIVVFGVMFFPSKLELYTKSRRRFEFSRNSKTSAIVKNLKDYILVLSNKTVLCLSLGLFSFCLGTYLVFMHLPKYVVEKGFSRSFAANLVSLSGILTALGRILTGVVASHKYIRDAILYCLPMFILGIMTIVYPFISHTTAGNVIFAIFLGSLYGNVYVLTASVSVKYVGILNLAKSIGIQYFFCGLGILLGPIMAGIVVDTGGTYDHSFYTSGNVILFYVV